MEGLIPSNKQIHNQVYPFINVPEIYLMDYKQLQDYVEIQHANSLDFKDILYMFDGRMNLSEIRTAYQKNRPKINFEYKTSTPKGSKNYRRFPKDGQMEATLFAQLKQSEIGTYIHKNVTVYRDDGPQVYYPDIVVIDSNSKVYIVVEVDEPYAYRNNWIGAGSKFPIHTYPDNEEFERSRYFLKHGWCVFRVSEFQVMFHEGHSRLADMIVENYKRLKSSKVFWPAMNVFIDLRWTVEEATKFAEVNFRYSRKHYINEYIDIRKDSFKRVTTSLGQTSEKVFSLFDEYRKKHYPK